MDTESRVRNFVSEKIGGFLEKTPGIVAFVVTCVIVVGIIT